MAPSNPDGELEEPKKLRELGQVEAVVVLTAVEEAAVVQTAVEEAGHTEDGNQVIRLILKIVWWRLILRMKHILLCG